MPFEHLGQIVEHREAAECLAISYAAQMRFGILHLHRLVMRCNSRRLHTEQVLAIREKYIHLRILLSDLPRLAEAAKVDYVSLEPAPDTEVKTFDATPRYRLAMALENGANLLYSIAELAAQIANKTTEGEAHRIADSFNGICRSIRKKTAPTGLAEALSDLTWYLKVREIRTECTHYSSLYVESGKDGVVIRIHTERHQNQREHLQGSAIFSMDDFVTWVRAALCTVDQLADFLLVSYVLPSYNLDEVRKSIKIAPSGFPVIQDGRMQFEDRTVCDLLRECGIVMASEARTP